MSLLSSRQRARMLSPSMPVQITTYHVFYDPLCPILCLDKRDLSKAERSAFTRSVLDFDPPSPPFAAGWSFSSALLLALIIQFNLIPISIMILAYPEARAMYSRQTRRSLPLIQHHLRSNAPEIDGSSGGYIALVVVLAVIAVVSAIGVFFLLRSQKKGPYEREARRALAGKREESLYQLPLGPQGMRQKFKNLFKFGRKRDGWTRASSGDEWDASDRLVYDPPTEGGSQWISGTSLYDAPQHREREMAPTPHTRVERSETSDSIELTVPPASVPQLSNNLVAANVASREPSHADVYTDPFASSPTVTRSSEMLPIDGEPTPRDDERRFTVRSGDDAGVTGTVRSMRKFESGTKFKEAL
ncbi:hypothetical protein NM688_g6030 [Phlebia brevispora]|uniref:Uncharacterized protein n=1 Tax=Phlebia brevispora TaxID=194682 RepID=A0ACC1SKY3_9APHY|nr:hypothetical protein NM688_g6030 [Phlebia brevispora]